MRYLITLFLSLSVLVTAGCGFRLQGTTQLPEELKTLQLSSGSPYSYQTRAVREQLRLNNVTILDSGRADVPILKIVGSSESTDTVSIYQDGKAAEKQLTLVMKAQVLMPDGTIYPLETKVVRTFFDNPLEALAKDAENEIVKQEMQEQAARSIVRKLLLVHSAELEKAKAQAAEKPVAQQ
ncbi:Rare lipoprotein B [Providencia rustigianii]|uniref:LPS-assembly lipoprotein LptE n=1 Tax=Providencia rustigianii TaxID=158850 RepID=A0A379G182_9GAMM|nr:MULTISPECIES: LPS assembly lipoprotein LptE [Providencia]MTC58129.1 LPS assembly lipoprotein LptE [Providencia rustigianii]MTC58694.1 LPS assembly lipoprotein LptE [Providencia rustigianii]SPY76842.1 Rare lipoprotein B [Providencia rustigianii]SUC26070.1 Rare lipoprotein B [Providencia rustigianii]SUC34769.1 Rare lipoprotein B [Providencia rustigianii]